MKPLTAADGVEWFSQSAGGAGCGDIQGGLPLRSPFKGIDDEVPIGRVQRSREDAFDWPAWQSRDAPQGRQPTLIAQGLRGCLGQGSVDDLRGYIVRWSVIQNQHVRAPDPDLRDQRRHQDVVELLIGEDRPFRHQGLRIPVEPGSDTGSRQSVIPVAAPRESAASSNCRAPVAG